MARARFRFGYKKRPLLTIAQVKELFLTYVKKTKSGCWLWLRGINKDGYGIVPYSIKVVMKEQYAHRAAWKLYRGKLTKGKPHVLHHCDNPACVRYDNDKHLYVGTQQDNNADKFKKGRQAKGAKHSANVAAGCKHKLSDEDALKIAKMLISNSATQNEIANLFNVSRSRVYAIAKRKGRFKNLPK